MKAMEAEAPAAPALKATPLLLAALASAGAGLIHGAAAGSHNGDRTLAILFAVTAAAQLGWAVLAIARPGRQVAATGAAMNLGFAAVWLVTRTVGMPVVTVLGTVDSPGLQDTMAASLAVAAAACALWSIAAVTTPAWLHSTPAAALAAVLVVAVTVPAMAAGHDHDADNEAHDVTVADPELDAQTVAFVEELDEEVDEATEDETTEDDAADTVDGYGHDHGPGGPVISLYDPRLTPDQRDAARQLIDDTIAGMARYPDVESVIAAGYFSIGDGITGFEHWVNPAFIIDGIELDPDRIESIVARVNPDGTKDIVSAMYLMGPGSTMDDVPDIAGPLTIWHDHQNLCWEAGRVVGTLRPDGSCPRGVFRATSPMLHVWLVPHPCGPFAGLEGHGGGCAHDEH
jgi:hypothetical protein